MSDVISSQQSPWLTEAEAAEYSRCSMWALRRMRLPAYNSGGRKVYFKPHIDAALLARPWAPPVPLAFPLLADRPNLRNGRIRPYKPRKPRAVAD